MHFAMFVLGLEVGVGLMMLGLAWSDGVFVTRGGTP